MVKFLGFALAGIVVLGLIAFDPRAMAITIGLGVMALLSKILK